MSQSMLWCVIDCLIRLWTILLYKINVLLSETIRAGGDYETLLGTNDKHIHSYTPIDAAKVPLHAEDCIAEIEEHTNAPTPSPPSRLRSATSATHDGDGAGPSNVLLDTALEGLAEEATPSSTPVSAHNNDDNTSLRGEHSLHGGGKADATLSVSLADVGYPAGSDTFLVPPQRTGTGTPPRQLSGGGGSDSPVLPPVNMSHQATHDCADEGTPPLHPVLHAHIQDGGTKDHPAQAHCAIQCTGTEVSI